VLAGLAALAFTDGNEPPAPPAVEPVPAGAGPAEEARNLAEWLRANSG
jgi:hypothetical protein